MRIAAVTMAYNEADFLPVWTRWYAGQLGPACCYILDHGSDDGSTDGLDGVNVIRLPRTALDEDQRARFVGEFCASLLHWYDAVLHADADEIVVPDPARGGFADLLARSDAPALTAFGLDLHHLPEEDGSIDPARPILAQRRWVRFNAALCKPALIRRPVAWSPGFHSADVPLELAPMFLFHLRLHDLGTGLRRLAKTRGLRFASPEANRHQRVPDGEFAAMLHAVARLPRRDGVAFDLDRDPLRDWADRLRASRAARETERYKLDLSLSGTELWAVPDRFRRLF